MSGRGEVRDVYLTRDERAMLERALRDGRVTILVADPRQSDETCEFHMLESLWQRGYLSRRPERLEGARVSETEVVFLPTSSVVSALRTAYDPPVRCSDTATDPGPQRAP